MTCDSGKVAYPSPQAAWAAIRLHRSNRWREAYQCPDCHLWHVHSQRPSDPRARTA